MRDDFRIIVDGWCVEQPRVWRQESAMLKQWYSLMTLGVECQTVVALRMARLMQGGTVAQAEAARMMSEKGTAAAEAAATLMTGGGVDKVVRGYRRHVRRNTRRLRSG